MSTSDEHSNNEWHTRAREKAELVGLARHPGRRSKLLDARQAAELRTAVDDVLQRAEGWRAPTREPGNGPPGPEELLMIVLRHYQRRSENTRALYARELVLYLAHCQSRGQDPYAVRSEHVEDYLALLGAAGLAEASRALALAAIAAYYRRAVHERAIDQDPCAIVERPKPAASEQNQARALSRPQVAQLLAAARARSALHELLVCLLFFNGLRVSEAAGADVEDLAEHQGHRVLAIRGKGNAEKNHRVPLNAPTIAALDRWLHERARIAAGADTGPLLLSPTTRRPLTRQAIYGQINRLARSAGLGELTPHGLRATMVTLALGAGMPLRDVQDSARHADPRTTRRYDRDRHSLNRHAALRLAELADPKPRP
ncbi:MAG: tyrosine-type recombinase/integrase [Solirubrobacteraceae bacterium]